MEKKLNNEQLAFFKQYEDYFININKYHCLGATDMDVEKELSKIYTEVTGRSLRDWNCMMCRKRNWNTLAILYFESTKSVKSVKSEKSEKDNKK